MENLKDFIKLDKSNKYKNQNELKGPMLILGYIGLFLVMIGVLTLLPLLMCLFYPNDLNNSKYYAFLMPGLFAILIGLPEAFILYKRKQGRMSILENMFLLLTIWVLAILFSSIPFYFFGYSFTQGIFEAVSGYTTTGLTILNWHVECPNDSLDGINHMLYFHRALNQLIGGVGLVLVVSSAIQARSGLNLYRLEGHNDRLLPNLVKSARMIFAIYLCYILVGMLGYMIVGVDPFDAFCNSIAAVSTGGFSTRPGSIWELSKEVSSIDGNQIRGIMVEIITEILMLLGGTNFLLHYSLFSGKVKNWRHFEFPVLAFIILFFYPLMVMGMSEYYNNIGDGFRYGTFEFITGVSTAGFQSIDSYNGHFINGEFITLPNFISIVLIILMTFGMQQGSTSGGIKDSRLYLVVKDIIWRIKKSFSAPEAIQVHTCYKFGIKSKISEEEVFEAESYTATYISITFIGAIFLSVFGHFSNLNMALSNGQLYNFTFMDYLFEFASSLAGCGLSFGITNNTTSAFILWIEIIGMMLGRLEIFIYFTFAGTTIKKIKNNKNIYKDKADAEILS